jgi:sulfatase maturation enzyme AslB (radical SAM superfamily)
MINKSLCSYPWVGSTIRPNGQLVPCCRYNHSYDNNRDATVDSTDPRSSKHWIELRQKMLAGEKISNCDRCYKDEESGMESMRQFSLKHYTPKNENLDSLLQLEVAFNNLCNLACVHCSSYSSSKWYNEDYKKGKIGKIGILENNFSIETLDLSQLQHLKIIGGEPLMAQEKFINLLKRIDLSKLNILIISNGTILPNNELRILLENSKHLSINISLDGLYSVNDWFRWPSKFNQIIENLQVYDNWFKKNSNVTLKIHCVINAINVLYLKEFVSYIKINFPNWEFSWDWLTDPSWQSVSILPSLTKEILIEEFKDLELNPFKITIDRFNDANNSDWNDFKKNVLILSNDRNLDFFKMLSKFKTVWEQ